MRSSRISACAIALVAAVILLAGERTPPGRPQPAAPVAAQRLLRHLPVAFVPNLGQWQHTARFVARFGPMTVFLTESGWTFTLTERVAPNTDAPESSRAVAVQMTFEGASNPELVTEERLPGSHNYFLGNDPSRWRSDVPLHGAVRYRGLYPGIDVRAREQDGHFEYDLLAQPGVALARVGVTIAGIERMSIDESGALQLETRLGPVRMPAPLSWEEAPSGKKHPVTCRYVLRGANRFGFEAIDHRPEWGLVVDPGLVWSTFVGGTGLDRAHALALDAQGAATVGGITWSQDYPVTTGAFDTSYNGNADAFVTRLSPSGSSLDYSTFIGGTNSDAFFRLALALDQQGAATITGETRSSDFPTTPGAYDTSYNGGFSDAFVSRLSPTGSSLVFSTLLGGSGEDAAKALALDGAGGTTITGDTDSTGFPTTAGAFDTSHNGNLDVYVIRLSPSGSSVVYSTFVGGRDTDYGNAIELDAVGGAIVGGSTKSFDFPTTFGAYDTVINGGYDGFVARLSPTGASLVYSTFVGGSGVDGVDDLLIDAGGVVTIAGETWAADFPSTSGAFDTTFNGMVDAFVAQLSATGSTLLYSTFIGGSGIERGRAIARDSRGSVTLVGSTSSADFPTTIGAYDTSYNTTGNPPADAVVVRLSPTGSSLVYSTFLGGTGMDEALALALDAGAAATVAGLTESPDFPTTPGAFDTTYNSGDAFVTRLDLLPNGTSAFGRSTPGCSGALAISVTSMPHVGNVAFSVTCSNAPPNATGLLLVAGGRFATPVTVLGAGVWVDPSLLFLPFAVGSDPLGASEGSLPIPNDLLLRGLRLFAQFFWGGPTSPPPCPPLGVSASNALEVTIQP